MGHARVAVRPADAMLAMAEVARLKAEGIGAPDVHLLALIRHVLREDAAALTCPRARVEDEDVLVVETDTLRVRVVVESCPRLLWIEWSAVLSPTAKRSKPA